MLYGRGKTFINKKTITSSLDSLVTRATAKRNGTRITVRYCSNVDVVVVLN